MLLLTLTLLCGLYEGDWNVDEEEEVGGGGSGVRGLGCLGTLYGRGLGDLPERRTNLITLL